MEVDVATSPPLVVVENTDISALVELLYEYTPRDLKTLISSDGARPKLKLSFFSLQRASQWSLTVLNLFSAYFYRFAAGQVGRFDSTEGGFVETLFVFTKTHPSVPSKGG